MNWLDSYLHRAFLEVILVGAVAGVAGVHVVLRRLSFFTMAMTHATFPGVVAAAVLGFNIYLGGAAAGVLATLAIAAASRWRGQDTATGTGVVLAGGFALGVVLTSAHSGFTKDLSAYLVGSVLTVSRSDLVITAAVVSAVLLVLTGLHKELTFAAFDPGGVRAAGYPAARLDLVALLAVDAVVVAAVPAIGTILAVALIVAPAAAALLWSDRIGTAMVIAAAIGVSSGVGGLVVSERYDVAAGGAISLLAAAAFVGSWLLSPRHGLIAQRIRPLARGRARAEAG